MKHTNNKQRGGTMTYYDSAKGQTITKKRAIKEVLDHGCELSEFFEDMGNKPHYNAQNVLNWLGY